MPRFPEAEPRIASLCRQIIDGLRNVGSDLPAPPVSSARLREILDQYDDSRRRTLAAQFAFRSAHQRKDEVLEELLRGMKATLRYAEAIFRKRPEKLRALGWGPPRPRVRLALPGQVLKLAIKVEGESFIVLGWAKPKDGGRVAAYKIQRRAKGGRWEDVGMSVSLQHRLEDQPTRVELEFRVVAMNKAGVGVPSATVRAVL